MIYHGHFPSDFGGFATEPPDPKMDTTDYSERFSIYGYKKFEKQEAYNFYKQWTGKNFPRFLVIEIQHATPYYDDSYAVNSANQGPYGDAIMYELLPEIEKKFRGIGQDGHGSPTVDQPAAGKRLRHKCFILMNSTGASLLVPIQLTFVRIASSIFTKTRMPTSMTASLKSWRDLLTAITLVRSRLPWKKPISTNWCWVLTAGPVSSGISGRRHFPRKAMMAIQSTDQ